MRIENYKDHPSEPTRVVSVHTDTPNVALWFDFPDTGRPFASLELPSLDAIGINLLALSRDETVALAQAFADPRVQAIITNSKER